MGEGRGRDSVTCHLAWILPPMLGGKEEGREGEGEGEEGSITIFKREAPVHEEQAPRRREAVDKSGRWTGCVVRGGEQGPGHVGGVEGVQVVERSVCGGRG